MVAPDVGVGARLGGGVGVRSLSERQVPEVVGRELEDTDVAGVVREGGQDGGGVQLVLLDVGPLRGRSSRGRLFPGGRGRGGGPFRVEWSSFG